jgi:hypothetical protein
VSFSYADLDAVVEKWYAPVRRKWVVDTLRACKYFNRLVWRDRLKSVDHDAQIVFRRA